jgi:hypothetical protein
MQFFYKMWLLLYDSYIQILLVFCQIGYVRYTDLKVENIMLHWNVLDSSYLPSVELNYSIIAKDFN